MYCLVNFQKPTATSPPGNLQTNLVTAISTTVTATTYDGTTTSGTSPVGGRTDGAATTMPAFASTPKTQVNNLVCQVYHHN